MWVGSAKLRMPSGFLLNDSACFPTRGKLRM